MKKSELTAALAACRTTAAVDPKGAMSAMAVLNARLDHCLGRISTADLELALKNPARALVKFEAQIDAFKNGELIL